MDPNNQRVNFSFEPQDGDQTREAPYAYHNNGYSGQPQPPKKEKGRGRIFALLLAVALAGGIGGSLVSGAIDRISENNAAKTAMAQQELADKEQAQPDTKEDSSEAAAPEESTDAFEIVKTPLPTKLNSNDGNKNLTPSQAYAMNVGAVAGIRTQTTTNVFGQVVSGTSSGTGFVLTSDGYIVTNNHVVSGGTEISVALYDGTEYQAQVIGTDSLNDVALLKVDATGLQTVTVAKEDDLVVGEEVIAIGNPLGELTFTMTQGYISALDRTINTDGNPINMLQTDAAINAGNSGGPLFDMNGNVVGVTTAKFSGSSGSGASIEGIGFAIPIQDVLRIVYDLQENGYVKGRAYFGITVMDMDSSAAKTYNLPIGAYVDSVNPGSCAEKAGLQPQDIIIGIGDQKIENRTELLSELLHHSAGETAEVTIFRAGAEIKLSVTFDERPSQEILDKEEAERQAAQQQQEQQAQLPRQGEPYQFPGFGDFFGFGN